MELTSNIKHNYKQIIKDIVFFEKFNFSQFAVVERNKKNWDMLSEENNHPVENVLL